MTRLSMIVFMFGAYSLSASEQDGAQSRESGRRSSWPHPLEPVPIDVHERFDGNDHSIARSPRAAGLGLVYESMVRSGFFLPRKWETVEEQVAHLVAEDLGLAAGDARELYSYMAWVTQRSDEGTLGFTVHMAIWTDRGTGVQSLPLDVIEASRCAIEDVHGLGRPDEGMAECLFNAHGDSGIIMDDKVWLVVSFEGGCIVNQQHPDCTEPEHGFFGPGWLISGGPPSVGTTVKLWVAAGVTQGNGALWGYLDFHHFGMLCNMRASVPAPIPTVSEWGMVVIAMLVLTGGTIVLRRRPGKLSAVSSRSGD